MGAAHILFWVEQTRSEVNMRHFGFAILSFGLLIVGGCAHRGGVVATYDLGQSPLICQTPREGEYLLSTIDAWEYVHLDAKQPIGFRRSDRGDLLAVAGSRQFVVPERHHCWVVVATGDRQPDTAIGEFQANVAADLSQNYGNWGRLLASMLPIR